MHLFFTLYFISLFLHIFYLELRKKCVNTQKVNKFLHCFLKKKFCNCRSWWWRQIPCLCTICFYIWNKFDLNMICILILWICHNCHILRLSEGIFYHKKIKWSEICHSPEVRFLGWYELICKYSVLIYVVANWSGRNISTIESLFGVKSSTSEKVVLIIWEWNCKSKCNIS